MQPANPAERQEGVIKFAFTHTPGPPPDHHPQWAELLALRQVLFARSWLGQDPETGIGYGNVSLRDEQGRIWVSGTGASCKPSVGLVDFCEITQVVPAQNRLWSRGPAVPSSESLTHTQVYAALPQVRFVVHIHHNTSWLARKSEFLLQTPETVAYGTPAMAQAVYEVCASYQQASGLLRMAGHFGGWVAWGETTAAVLAILETVIPTGGPVFTPEKH